jgi:polyisoprenoid-binding protein YceI
MSRSILCLLPLLSGVLWAQPVVLHIEPAHTEVEYLLGATLHSVHGTFHLKRGDFTFDPATGKATGELVVDAASGSSGNESRDKKMHQDILQSAKYPDIVFRPDRVDGKVATSGHSDVQLHGVFSLHGADHEMMVPLSVDAANGGYQAVATFTVPYIKWGLKNPSTFLLRVSDKVEITVKTSAR